MDPFEVKCSYCPSTHTAKPGEGTIHGFAIWDVYCPDAGIRYGVSQYTDTRINPVPLPEVPAERV
jgi:hypothetical protein